MLRRLLLALALLALVACTTKPIQNPREVFPTDHPFAAADVREAILTALQQRGWATRSEAPGQITASIDVRGRHQAWIDIPYSTQGYQIRYRDSAGLDYDGQHIHRNYNKWVHLLDVAIRRQLQLPAPTAAAD
ncbi:hypothetical protein NS274_20440 [Pseudomonas oryzihabitans]|nr:hypothetical protein BJP27_10960 [Pseudomonas psychrotolerans]KTS73382.1 hypothetical protein NS274_20440 [Pseudomonas psychrotolerans]KTT03850.1 hypothetical protein NS376_07340 [Pseudomonas psychrotolerans]KTT28192.1 hypothetical protein SB9_23540 [Pseudomonas psychrotolerans]KTT32610.1 hypothetical protein NS201_07520 [Pseudomonas psychrotolerans]